MAKPDPAIYIEATRRLQVHASHAWFKDDKGAAETWVLHGRSLNNALRDVGSLKERLKPGTPISARVWPPRIPLQLNDALTVWPAKSDDAGKSSRIAGAGQIRFSNGDVVPFGGGPTF